MRYVVSGDTFPARLELKLCGCRYEQGKWRTERADIIDALKKIGCRSKNLKVSIDKTESKS